MARDSAATLRTPCNTQHYCSSCVLHYHMLHSNRVKINHEKRKAVHFWSTPCCVLLLVFVGLVGWTWLVCFHSPAQLWPQPCRLEYLTYNIKWALWHTNPSHHTSDCINNTASIFNHATLSEDHHLPELSQDHHLAEQDKPSPLKCFTDSGFNTDQIRLLKDRVVFGILSLYIEGFIHTC